MKVNHNEKELKKLEKTGFPNERVEKRLEMEMQQLDSAQNFREYCNVPRSAYARTHVLSGNYRGSYAVGLDPRFRLIVNPLGEPAMEAKECDIIKYVEDYHKG